MEKQAVRIETNDSEVDAGIESTGGGARPASKVESARGGGGSAEETALVTSAMVDDGAGAKEGSDAHDEGAGEGAAAPLEGRIAELEQRLEDADVRRLEDEARLAAANASLAEAVSRYRAMLMESVPEAPASMVSGETVDEVDRSFAEAKAVVQRVRQQVEDNMAQERMREEDRLAVERRQMEETLERERQRMQEELAVERRREKERLAKEWTPAGSPIRGQSNFSSLSAMDKIRSALR